MIDGNTVPHRMAAIVVKNLSRRPHIMASKKGFKGVTGKQPTNVTKMGGRMSNTFTNPTPKTRKVTRGRGY